MSNIIEKLVIEVGFDAKGAVSGLKTLNQDFQKTKKESESLSKSISKDSDNTSASLKKVKSDLQKTSEKSKDTAEKLKKDGDIGAQFFVKIRNEAILLFGLLTAGKGIKSFISDTIQSTAQLGFMSDTIGQTTEQITELQLAAERMGGSKAGIAGLVAQSARELAEFRTQGKGALVSSDFLGFMVQGGKTQGLTTGLDVLLEKANVLKNVFDTKGEGAGMESAALMGISPENIPLMRQGSNAIRKQMEDMKRLAIISKDEAKQAQEVNAALVVMKKSFENISTQLLLKFLPAIEKVSTGLDSIADWVNKNLDSKIDAAAKGIAGAIEPFFLPERNKPKGTGAGRRESTATLTDDLVGRFFPVSNELKEKSKHPIEFFMQRGWTREQAVGITANLWAESGLDPKKKQLKGGPGRGLAQWTHGDAREAEFKKMFHKEIIDASMDEQLAFIDWELRNTEKKAGYNLSNAKTAKNAASVFDIFYERSKDVIGDSYKRGQIARNLFAETYDNTKAVSKMASANSNTSAGATDKSINMNVGTVNVTADDTKGLMDDMLKQSNMRANLFTQYNTGM